MGKKLMTVQDYNNRKFKKRAFLYSILLLIILNAFLYAETYRMDYEYSNYHVLIANIIGIIGLSFGIYFILKFVRSFKLIIGALRNKFSKPKSEKIHLSTDLKICPKCGYNFDQPSTECPKCNVVVKKYLIIEDREKKKNRRKVRNKAIFVSAVSSLIAVVVFYFLQINNNEASVVVKVSTVIKEHDASKSGNRSAKKKSSDNLSSISSNKLAVKEDPPISPMPLTQMSIPEFKSHLKKQDEAIVEQFHRHKQTTVKNIKSIDESIKICIKASNKTNNSLTLHYISEATKNFQIAQIYHIMLIECFDKYILQYRNASQLDLKEQKKLPVQMQKEATQLLENASIYFDRAIKNVKKYSPLLKSDMVENLGKRY